MLKYKRNTAAETAEITEEQLHQHAVGKIFIIVTAGLLLLMFDLFIGLDGAPVPFLRGNDGAYLIRPDEGSGTGHVFLVAEIQTDRGTVTKEYELALYPCEQERTTKGTKQAGRGSTSGVAGTMSEDELLAYEMRNVISSLNDDRSIRRVLLPDRLLTGEKITWKTQKKTHTAMIAMALIILTVFTYTRRLDPLQKIRRAKMESVTRQLPEFASRLVLLLGAGLVLSEAFERIVEETRQTESLEGDYFYSSMAEIYNKIKETNSSIQHEFRAFARSSDCSCEGSRELMRISNIISDNISKGAELTDKLQSESEALWLSRKRNSEERGRLAETKLTMPLTVFLLVLVVVTVSPALLEL